METHTRLKNGPSSKPELGIQDCRASELGNMTLARESLPCFYSVAAGELKTAIHATASCIFR